MMMTRSCFFFFFFCVSSWPKRQRIKLSACSNFRKTDSCVWRYLDICMQYRPVLVFEIRIILSQKTKVSGNFFTNFNGKLNICLSAILDPISFKWEANDELKVESAVDLQTDIIRERNVRLIIFFFTLLHLFML